MVANDCPAYKHVLIWILIAALVFMLVIAVENHLKAKRARQKKIKSISQRLKLLDKRKNQHKSDN
jgi:large-conductance mechanosensitive channel